MMYIVIFFEEYVGCHFDENTKIFNDINKAKKYCEELNKDFAGINMCEVEDLGDYYIIEKVTTE